VELPYGCLLYSTDYQLQAMQSQPVSSDELRPDEVHVDIQGACKPCADLPPTNPSFVIDASSSMADDRKLEWVKQVFDTFINQVRDKDFVSLVTFDDEAQVLSPYPQMRSPEHRRQLQAAVQNIYPSGGPKTAADSTHARWVRHGIVMASLDRVLIRHLRQAGAHRSSAGPGGLALGAYWQGFCGNVCRVGTPRPAAANLCVWLCVTRRQIASPHT
jgi:hypothetical protein